MVEKLRKHLDNQDLDRQEAAEKWQENGLIFPTTIGNPWRPGICMRILENY